MMLVGFYLPVWLGELYIKEMPSTIMLVGFYLPVRLGGWLLKRVFAPAMMLVGFYLPVQLEMRLWWVVTKVGLLTT